MGASGLAVREWGDPAQPGILLWPGLGATGAYFAGVAPVLPGRGVAVDPPGCGGSEALASGTFDELISIARDVFVERGCTAVVGHSLGAYVAVGLAADPPPGFRAAVLIDGGFLDPDSYTELGMPVSAGRSELVAWMEANQARFADWESAVRELGPIVGGEGTPALEAYVRDVFAEIDGEVRERMAPERMADLLLAVVEPDVRAQAARVRVPTLLIACGRPQETRATREEAWTRFARASPLTELQVFDEWGHNPVVQDPERASRLIADWLAAGVR